MDDGPNSESGPTIRSIHSRIPKSVRFVNHSSVHAKVIWINHEGEQVLYSTLQPLNGFYDVRTYVTHPWIAVEEESNLRMLLNSAQIFFPTSDGDHQVVISANSNSGPNIRSIHSRIPKSVRFLNHSSVPAKVIWINYEGEQVLYSTLKPLNGCYDVRTYVTHPWIAVEEESNLRMLLNLAQIYFPTSDGDHHQVVISANGM